VDNICTILRLVAIISSEGRLGDDSADLYRLGFIGASHAWSRYSRVTRLGYLGTQSTDSCYADHSCNCTSA
jgi:hypothetical protein